MSYGIKPTQLRVPRYGSVGRGPATANLFSQSGPMSRTVKDSAILLQVLSGHDPRDPMSLKAPVPDFVSGLNDGVKGLKIGWTPDFGYAPVDPEVLRISEAAARNFESLGATVEEVDVGLQNPFRAFWTMFSTNAYSSYGHLLNSNVAELTSYGRYSLEQGKATSGAALAQALNQVNLVKLRFEELLDEYGPAYESNHAHRGLPRWPGSPGSRRQEAAATSRLHTLHLPHQHERPDRRQHSPAASQTACLSGSTSSARPATRPPSSEPPPPTRKPSPGPTPVPPSPNPERGCEGRLLSPLPILSSFLRRQESIPGVGPLVLSKIRLRREALEV